MPGTDPLHRYRTKRDFGVTAEPAGPARTGRRERVPVASRIFVVQKHAARRLHYDFRLEMNGTLKSWAVPKGPSLDPGVKRLAVHVEDHPLDYADFEGTIPAGQYGAGEVIVWDRGTWVPEGDPLAGYGSGKLAFELRGEKLSGRWALVRTTGRDDGGRASERQESWLLIKERDAAARTEDDYSVVDERPDSVRAGPPPDARPAPLPERLAPQLATLVEKAPTGSGWSWEMKFDGYRILARIDGRKVRLYTRNGHDWTSRMRSLAQEVAALELPSGWLDGEIVVQGRHGAPDFQRLQNAFDEARTEEILYYVFDMPYCAGYDLRAVPLQRRRALLHEWLEAHPSRRVLFSEDFAASPESLLRSACELRMEGLIGKRTDSTYVSRRSPAWIKVKCTERQEFVVGGYTDPRGSRNGFGALLLGVHDEHGTLRYAGRVGSGFDEDTLGRLLERLQSLASDESPFADVVRERAAHWVRPELVAEVSFTQWTADGRIRHPVFHGLRDDKPARAVTLERAAKAEDAAKAANGSKAASASNASPGSKAATPGNARREKENAGAAKAAQASAPAGVRVTHPQRVIDASTGITKLELVRYYAEVAPRMLPHLARRPVALVRAPSGVNGEKFFQKHATASALPGVRSLDPKYDPGEEPLIEIATQKGLATVAQMNAVELHTWNATTRAIEKPDRMVFDLDPGEGVPWSAMREAAQLVHALLDELGLASFLKTSGGKGLHVVVPLTPKDGWDAVKGLSKEIVVHLARTLPDRFVAKSGASNRKGRIFADYLRNGRGATTAAAWSARARPGIGISVPLAWDELPAITSGDQWTLRNVESRWSQPDPWVDYASTRQTLASAMRALACTPPRAPRTGRAA